MKKCPVCDLNYIADDENICDVCNPKPRKSKPHKDVSIKTKGEPILSLEYCHTYGTNSLDIYLRLCDGMGFKGGEGSCFGHQGAIMFAPNVYKGHGLWMISKPLYHIPTDKEKSACKAAWIDYISSKMVNGKLETYIYEYWLHKSPTPENSRRIVFFNSLDGYQFAGIFEYVETDLIKKIKVYKRVYENFTIDYPQ